MSAAPAVLHLNGQDGHAAPIRRGDDYSHSVPCFNVLADGTRVPDDKSGSTFLSQIRATPKSDDIIEEFLVTVTGIDLNIVTWSLTDAKTTVLPPGTWAWDLQEDTGLLVITRFAGIAKVGRDVSRP